MRPPETKWAKHSTSNRAGESLEYHEGPNLGVVSTKQKDIEAGSVKDR